MKHASRHSHLAAAILASFASAAPAATLDWNASASFWDVSAGWTPSGPPTSDDIARFNVNTTQTLQWRAFTGDRSVSKLQVLAGRYSFDNLTANPYLLTLATPGSDGFLLSGGGTSLTLKGLELVVSNGGAPVGTGTQLQLQQGSGGLAAKLSVTAAALNVSGAMNVGQGSIVTSLGGSVRSLVADTDASALITGTGSAWNLTGGLIVGGSFGSNTLNVINGGLVAGLATRIGNLSSQTGVVNVTGAASKFTHSDELLVGFNGKGTLNANSGALVTSSAGTLGNSVTAKGTATISGSGTQWLNSADLQVGSQGEGMLTVDSGGYLSNVAGYVGKASGSTGFATIAGAGSHWNSSAGLSVGDAGGGSLSVQTGGKVTNRDGVLGNQAGSVGNGDVSGAGSQWLNSGSLTVGNSGTGMLTVEGGGLLSTALGRIGYLQGASGDVSLSGTGSKWNNSGDLFVGYNGMGGLGIVAGAQATGVNGSLGFNPGSKGTATLSGAGTAWASSGELRVGYRGEGTLDVSGGAHVSNTAGYVGLFANATGLATVTGAGTAWTNTGPLNVGTYGHGELKVLDGAVVNSKGGNVGSYLVSAGTVTISGVGSKWLADGNLYLGGSPDADDGGGATVTIADGGSFVVNGMTVSFGGATLRTEAGGSTQLLGGLSGSGAFTGPGPVTIGGELSPGFSPGRLAFGGSLTLTGMSHMEVGGLIRGDEYDAIDVAGALNLGGSLNVGLIDGFTPAAGSSFDLFKAERFNGSFASFAYPALASGLEWHLDLLVNVNGSRVDVLRLSAVQAASLPIPEPAAAWLWAAGLVAVLTVRRRAARAFPCEPSRRPDRT